MEWFILINLGFAIYSWRIASRCETWSVVWWLNMFASAINGAAVLFHIL